MKRLVAPARRARCLLVPAVASAHPLGNFTINRFARVEVAGHRLYVRYVVDMAEIPTLQRVPISHRAGSDVTRRRLARRRSASCARRSPIRVGAAGLHTTRFQAILAGPLVAGDVHDRRTATTTTRAGSAGRRSSSARTRRSTSDELRAYPKDLLQSPLDVHVGHREARARRATRRPCCCSGKALAAPDRIADSGFASLIGRGASVARSSCSRRSPPRCSGAPRTRCRRGTARRSSRRTRRPARDAVACGAARADHDRDAHSRRLRARARDARALAVHRPRHALPVARPRLRAARRRRRLARARRAGARARPRARPRPPPRPRSPARHSHDHGHHASPP